MNDTEWLLKQLDRWRDPNFVPATHEHVLAAVASREHQQIASRLSRALQNAPVKSPDLPLPAPC
jgi:hypothetical protein